MTARTPRYLQPRPGKRLRIFDLDAKKVDAANIARQVGVSRQCVYTYLQMKQPPERTRIHREGRPDRTKQSV